MVLNITFFYMLLLFFILLHVVTGDVGNYIIGGIRVPNTNDDFRAIASLQRKYSTGYKHFCGATLIAPSWLMTAAHCVKYTPPDMVRVGSYDTSSGGYIRDVDLVIRHPLYSGINNDIALLRLTTPVTSVSPMLIDNGVFGMDWTGIISIGWGYTSEGSGVVMRYLRQVDLVVYPHDACLERYRSVSEWSMLCTWGVWDDVKQRRGDACSGDSGSPNFHYDKDNGVSSVVGITSWGRGCGRSDYPGVTTRVSSYLSWIRKEITRADITLPPVIHYPDM